jgi:hypothetical protein
MVLPALGETHQACVVQEVLVMTLLVSSHVIAVHSTQLVVMPKVSIRLSLFHLFYILAGINQTIHAVMRLNQQQRVALLPMLISDITLVSLL